MENGYAVWDWRGREMQKHVIEKFKQLLWRPRPRSLLTKEQQKTVRRNLREIGKQFEEEDAAEESNAALQHRELYQRKLDEWRAWRQNSIADLNEHRNDLGLGPFVPVQKVVEEEQMEEQQEWIEEGECRYTRFRDSSFADHDHAPHSPRGDDRRGHRVKTFTPKDAAKELLLHCCRMTLGMSLSLYYSRTLLCCHYVKPLRALARALAKKIEHEWGCRILYATGRGWGHSGPEDATCVVPL
jgi:hypothetical protein